MQEQLAEIRRTGKSNRGGARPGAGRKAIPAEQRALRDAVAALDHAATALVVPGEPTLQIAAELVAGLANALRARLLARSGQYQLLPPLQDGATSPSPGDRPWR